MSKTVELPGGHTVELYEPAEITARRKRPVTILMGLHGDLLQKVALASTVVLPDGTREVNRDLTGADLDLTAAELLALEEYQDAAMFAVLKAWSLDQPLPATPDDLLELPDDLYTALKIATAKSGAEAAGLVESFEVPEDADGNQTVPFGNSADSKPSSPAVKKPSDRKPKSGSKSTGA